MLYLDIVPDEILSNILSFLVGYEDKFFDMIKTRNVGYIVTTSILLIYPNSIHHLKILNIDYITEIISTLNINVDSVISFISCIEISVSKRTKTESLFEKFKGNFNQVIYDIYKLFFKYYPFLNEYIGKNLEYYCKDSHLLKKDLDILVEDILGKSFDEMYYSRFSYYRSCNIGKSCIDTNSFFSELLFMFTFPKFYRHIMNKLTILPIFQWDELYYNILVILHINKNKKGQEIINDYFLENIIISMPLEYWFHYPELLLSLS